MSSVSSVTRLFLFVAGVLSRERKCQYKQSVIIFCLFRTNHTTPREGREPIFFLMKESAEEEKKTKKRPPDEHSSSLLRPIKRRDDDASGSG